MGSSTTTYLAKLLLPGGDCGATLDVVRTDGKPEDRKARSEKSEPAKLSDGKVTEHTITTAGDVVLRVSSRERRTCFEAPYRLSVTAVTDGEKP